MVLEQAVGVGAAIGNELLIFAGVGFVLGGISDIALDAFWIGRGLWRCCFVYRRHKRASASSFPHPATKRIAIFVPIWHEDGVIEAMLRHAVAVLNGGDWRIYVGTYPNDAASAQAARLVDHPRLRIVSGNRPGPTTKADCLNTIWRSLVATEKAGIM